MMKPFGLAMVAARSTIDACQSCRSSTKTNAQTAAASTIDAGYPIVNTAVPGKNARSQTEACAAASPQWRRAMMYRPHRAMPKASIPMIRPVIGCDRPMKSKPRNVAGMSGKNGNAVCPGLPPTNE